MDKITLKAPAKVNLFLEVLGKRRDGYHNIETILQEVNLNDIITLREVRTPDIVIQSDSPSVPTDYTNLAFKAASILKRYIGEEKRGVVIAIEKNIPIAAGLGGGSSDAAATLKGLNKLWKLGLDKSTLLNLAEKIGMDVPFFIEGGLCLARERGEKLIPLRPISEIWFLLTAPPVSVSTAWVYRTLSISPLTRKIKKNRIILDAIGAGDVSQIGKHLFNRLEEVTIKRYREIGILKQKISSAGAQGVLMSGSGPAVFGIFSSRQWAYRGRNRLNYKEGVYVVRGL